MRVKALVIIVMILFSASISRAAESVEPVSLNQLVEEIRQLRTAMQQAWSLQVRAQLLLEQIKQQREIINDLGQTIETSREESLNQTRQKTDYEEQAKELEAKLGTILDSKDNAGIRDELRGIRKAIEQSVALESRYKLKEIESQSGLGREEARMAELNKNLELLSASFNNLGVPTK
jgi:chromosome segregation ATPase